MPWNRSCGSYGPGHLMHWIQAKKSHEDGQPIIKVKVVAIHTDGSVEIEGEDLKLTHTWALARILAIVGSSTKSGVPLTRTSPRFRQSA
jgi:hypothetical protein